MNQLSFLPPEAVKLRPPSEPILRSAMIDGDCRFDLRRQWGSGPCIAWCGLNPSTADGTSDDPTMWREMAFSRLWGYGSLIKVNLYPFRSPHPAALRNWLLRSAPAEAAAVEDAIERNHREVAAALRECDFYMAAWGNAAVAEADLKEFLDRADYAVLSAEDLDRLDDPAFTVPQIAWHCLGINQDGSPKHTIARGRHRVPDDQKPQPWKRPST